MRPLRRNCLALLGLGLAGIAMPSPSPAAEPKPGTQYLELRVPQPPDTGDKVEVIEFFAYYCPHCYAWEPQLTEWVKKQGDNIVFKRVHIQLNAAVLPQERLFYTLEAMGLLPRYHEKVFDAMHGDGPRLRSDEEVFDWAAKNGIDREKFVDVYRSFGIQAKLRRVGPMMDAYDVDWWPMVAIGGRWITSPAHASRGLPPGTPEPEYQQAALQIMDYLVERAKAAPAAK
jgi:thiol:disulfide interchange protein DsbA